MSLAHLVLIRHGQTSTNGGGAGAPMSGWTDLPLSALGRRQVTYLAGGDAVVDVEHLYSSPLVRARDTATAIDVRGGEVSLCDDLRELGCGAVDGVPIEQVRRDFATTWARNAAEDDDDFRWPGGESYAELRRRAVAALDLIAADHPGERVGVVTHAGFITQVLGHLHGVRAARWSAFRVGNASITELEWSAGAGRLVRFDDKRHLPLDLRT